MQVDLVLGVTKIPKVDIVKDVGVIILRIVIIIIISYTCSIMVRRLIYNNNNSYFAVDLSSNNAALCVMHVKILLGTGMTLTGAGKKMCQKLKLKRQSYSVGYKNVTFLCLLSVT